MKVYDVYVNCIFWWTYDGFLKFVLLGLFKQNLANPFDPMTQNGGFPVPGLAPLSFRWRWRDIAMVIDAPTDAYIDWGVRREGISWKYKKTNVNGNPTWDPFDINLCKSVQMSRKSCLYKPFCIPTDWIMGISCYFKSFDVHFAGHFILSILFTSIPWRRKKMCRVLPRPYVVRYLSSIALDPPIW